MKNQKAILASLLCLILSAGSAFGQLSGTKTIGPSGDYTTFTAAVTDLNAQGVAAPGVTFLIADGTYNENQVAIIIATNQPTAASPIVFKPAPGATVVLNLGAQTSTNKYALRIGDSNVGGSDYITLDGSNTNGGTTRDMTINASDATNGYEPIDIWGDYVTVKNCIINCGSGLESVATTSYGITLREGAPIATNATIQNNKITSNYAIAVGRAAGGDIVGSSIIGNEIHGWKRGILVASSSGIQIRNNEIAGDVNPVWNNSAYGIEFTSSATNTAYITGNNIHNFGSNQGLTAASNIYGMNISGAGTFYIGDNKIWAIMNGTAFRSTSNVSAVGIFMANGSKPTYYVYDNMIYALDDTSSNAQAGFTAGIRTGSTATGTLYVYNNSIYMKNIPIRTHSTAAYMFSSAASPNQLVVTCQNNIAYVNVTGYSSSYKSFALYKTANAILTSDYNDFYNDGGGLYSYVTTTGAGTWSEWLAGGQDAHSVSMSPANPFGANGQWTSETNLHWVTKPNNALIALALSSPFNTDIDGDTRSGTFPYMGADEIPGTPLPVELASFTAHASAKGAILSWQTATEVNNRGFAIERRAVVSGSSSDWQQVGFVQGAGTSNAAHSYSYSDQVAMPGKYAYRLKQMDNDGAFKYYNEIEVTVGAVREFKLYGNYPNPFNPSTAIRFTVSQDGPAEMKVFNAIGQEVATIFSGYAQAGVMQEATFNASQMPSGMYFARLKSGSSVSVIKMMLMK